MKHTTLAFNESLIVVLVAVLAEGDRVYGEERRLAQSRDPCWHVRARTEGRDGMWDGV